ncbi:MAG: hypothetical protein J6C33_02410 [Lachnospiraceae bacterium]|nr:hypothetical protein [Lachnospiraceae bacterium]
MGSYTGDLKCNLKSVRMTDKVYEYVQAFEGEGFNQKFENMVLYFMEYENQKKRTIQELDKQIAARWDELKQLEQGKVLMDDALRSLQSFREMFSSVIPHSEYERIADMIRHEGYAANQEVVEKIFRLDQVFKIRHEIGDIYRIFQEQEYEYFPEEQKMVNDIVTEFQYQEMVMQGEIAL